MWKPGEWRAERMARSMVACPLYTGSSTDTPTSGGDKGDTDSAGSRAGEGEGEGREEEGEGVEGGST